MKLEFTEEQKAIQQAIREFLNKEVAPYADRWEKEDYFPREALTKLGELGFMGMTFPEEYGGAGIDYISSCLVIEEIAKISASLAIIVSVHNSVGCYPIYKYGNEEQKKKYLKPLAQGKLLGGFALTEPNAGSDAAAIKTRAIKENDHYILNGTKAWVTNAGAGGIIIVQAVSDPSAGTKGISSFIVETNFEGCIISKKEDKLGLRCSITNEVSFENCIVPKENLLAQEGMGFKIAMDALDGARIGVAAQAIGIAEAAMEKAIEYSKIRTAFGKPLSSFEGIQFMIADIATKIEAARLLMLKAAQLKNDNRRCLKEASMAKLYASEICNEVTNKALQIYGAYGYSRDYPLERYLRDGRVTSIYEGTSEIQRIIIAREILKNNW